MIFRQKVSQREIVDIEKDEKSILEGGCDTAPDLASLDYFNFQGF